MSQKVLSDNVSRPWDIVKNFNTLRDFFEYLNVLNK